jgi:subtilisin-like proprotein convertase family protein
MPTTTPTNTVTPTNTATPPNTATATVTQTATPACLITNYPSTDVGQSLVATCVTGCFDATITSTLSINTPATIGGIEVTGLNITSTYAAGLQVYLISPQGTTVPLFNRVCGDTPWPAGSTGFTLAESGAALIGSNCPPGASVYQPQGDLTSLNGQPANGTWTLMVTLTSAGSDNITNEATLYGWGLRISSGAGCPPPPPRRTATATPTPFPTFPPFNSPTATVTPTASTTPFCYITSFTQDVPVSSFLGTPVASSLDVPSGIPFSQIEVTNLVITAPIPANINLSLISPQNTVVQLMTGACPSGPPWTSANTGFSLSDLAGIPIGAACPPGFGTYRPVGSLSTFVGQSSGGAWRLLISGDTATVSSWTLEFIDGTGCGGGLNTVANGGGLLPPTVTPRMTPTAIRTPAQPPGLGPPATPFTGAATATPIAAPASAPPVPPATATPYRKGPPPRGGYADPVGATNSALDGALAADHSLGLLAGWRMTNQLVDIIFKECLLRLWSVPAGASP